MTKLSHVVSISFLWAITLFTCSPLWGQCGVQDAMAFNNYRIIPFRYAGEYTCLETTNKEKKWNGAYIGGRLALIGAGALLYVIIDGLAHGDAPPVYSAAGFTQSQRLTELAIAVAGLGLVFGGGAMVNHYRAKHKTAVIISGNRVGLAYNFR